MGMGLPSANILTLRTLRRLLPARMIFSKESPQYAAVSSKYFMPYTRIYKGPAGVSHRTREYTGAQQGDWGLRR